MFGKVLLASLLALSALPLADAAEADRIAEKRANAARQEQEGNYQFALTLYRELALDSENSPKYAAAGIAGAARMINRLGKPEELEPLLAKAAEVWGGSWRVLSELARRQTELPPLVSLTDGEYVRTQYWRGRNFNASERDRVVALRLMLKAETLLDQADDPADARDRRAFYVRFANILGMARVDGAAWRLTALTNLASLPDPEDYDTYYSRGERGAPVDADGNPLYYSTPASWDAAANDGERWRWLLGRIAASGAKTAKPEADLLFAQFLLRQFGVHTMGHNLPVPRDDGSGRETGPFAVRTLAENETIARLATGLKRFTLPDEFDFIRILREISRSPDKTYRAKAAKELARIFENRQQYAKAVECWERAKASVSGTDEEVEAAIKRITAKNGMLEAGMVRPAGSATSIPYLFRNGEAVAMKAERLDEKTLLADIRRLIKSNRREAMDMNPAANRPEQIGRLVVERNATKYIKETVAEWEIRLDPLPDHLSRRTKIDMPFSMAGCYLVTAKMRGGNESRIILWIADLALVRKPAFDKQILYVADAATGAPASDATVSFFGYTQRYRRDTDIPDIKTREFAERTDKNGLAVMNEKSVDNYNWLISAETPDGRFAYLGFDHIWAESPDRLEQGRESTFVITDRPVYRPDQKVNFKIWLGNPRYQDDARSTVANRQLNIEIHNPRGDTVYAKTLTTDIHGGVSDELVLDKNAPLGAYYINTTNVSGGAQFRLEEYKKPEFEVTVDTPDKALLLGDAVEIKVNAKYYFGSPVAKGKVAYKVTRTAHNETWYPAWRWDWLYGSGSSWQSYDYAWLPGWNDWGVRSPLPPWMPPRFSGPPELVAEGEGELDPDGVFRLPVDTMPAKELYGDSAHQYQISVEVTDQSRRVITGSGRVVASRKPFTATVWADRGYYQVGQRMNVSVRAARPLGGPVSATGKATLHRITYDSSGTPHEEEVLSNAITTNAEGVATLSLQADRPGQYRLSCIIADESGVKVEGAAVLTIRGGANEGDFRFAAIELVPDRRDYQPGDTIRLAINSERKDATVLLFPRTERKGELPVVVKLENGSKVVDLTVMPEDQPNFFCTVVTVFDGGTHSETREIFVPPAQKALSVQVKSNADSYAPGARAEFEVTVVNADGKPVQGDCVVTVYDKSVEYISGGSNVGDIRAHFWQWKRHYYPGLLSSLDRSGYRPMKKGDVNWEPIGIFGGQEADWNDDGVYTNGRLSGGSARERRVMKFDALAMPVPGAAPMASMAVAESADMEMKQEAPRAQPMQASGGGADSVMAEPEIRSEFADTALWIAALRTDSLGRASFSLDMPENLTAWKVRTWTMATETRVGEDEALVETRKNIMVRPQLPRFLTQKDQVVLSANLHNYLPRAKDARVELVLEGGLLEPADGTELSRTIRIAAGGEERVDWLVNARRPGEARVVMKILTDEESDAAEVAIPVIVHGARRVESFGGVIRSDGDETTIKIRVPKERLADRSRLELTFSPSIASSMLDALPFLIEYPYGCTEQTLNRFLPVVMTRKYLDNLGLSLSGARGVIANQRADAKSAEWLGKFGDKRRDKGAAVFDDSELAAMTRQGVERLAAMQVSDGGWGWFSGWGERSWPHTTAVVVHGLATAKASGAAIPSDVLESGIDWLRGYQNGQIDRLKAYISADPDVAEKGKQYADNLDAFIYMILAGQERFNPDMRDYLVRDRLRLSLSGLAMLGIALHLEGATNALPVVLGNLEQYLERDAENGAAWLRTPNSGWWWWYNDDIETQAWYLKLLSLAEPKGDTASGVARHLLRNRKNGAYWRSTRDTAYAIEALAHYATASGEAAPDMTVAVYYDGVKVMERTLKAENILDDNRFLLEGLAVEEGDHEIRIVRTGSGNVYFGGSLDLFSLEDPIAKAGGEMKVERAFYKLTREDRSVLAPDSSGRADAMAVEKYRRDRLPSPFDKDASRKPSVQSGDLVEVELTIETKNDYEYLVFEDMKAAGLEAVELRSGYGGNGMGAYVEYRDDKVVLFIRHLPRGTHTIAYRFRAKTPGSFSALPAFGGGMYATDLFANSDEMKIGVVDGSAE